MNTFPRLGKVNAPIFSISIQHYKFNVLARIEKQGSQNMQGLEWKKTKLLLFENMTINIENTKQSIYKLLELERDRLSNCS